MQKQASRIGKECLNVITKSVHPKVWLISLAVFFLLLFFCIIAVIIGLFAGRAGNQYEQATNSPMSLSADTENCRELVKEYCKRYGIDDYVDLILAMIQQESGGNGPDVMQAEESYYNTKPPVDSVEESIDYGVHEFSDCLKNSHCKGPCDVEGISLALQGYNFGNGYIGWALKEYNGYSLSNAEVFSKKMCKQLGCSGYGDPEYVPHVLRYYNLNEVDIENEKAIELLKELKQYNAADMNVWRVIEKGASLTGAVTYGMFDPPRQDDGRDHPTVLDCSSFTTWCFHKSGYTQIPYTSTTSTFITSQYFTTITAEELKVGDIGLKSKTAPTGGANHVGIYCGKRKDGTKVWLHCTSSSGSSMTGNTSGVMMGAYTEFTYFRRLQI